MITIGKLNQLGCDTSEGLSRCLGDETFYLSLIPMALENSKYEALESFIDKGELKEAFDVAHALKGVLSNLSLTPLYEIISELTEQLRIRDSKDLSELLKRMWEIKKKFDELI